MAEAKKAATKKATAKKPATKKAATRKATKKQDTDQIVKASMEVENTPAGKITDALRQIDNTRNFDIFRAGGYIRRALDEKIWKSEGYESSAEFFLAVIGFKERKALYYASIYTALLDSGVRWTEKVAALGWTKLRVISRVITEDNRHEWLAKAEKCSSVAELEAMVKAALGSPEGGAVNTTQNPPDTLKSKTYKFHPDQLEVVERAIATAKRESETQYDSVALEFICLGYLGNEGSDEERLRSLMQKVGYESAINVYGELFPELDIVITAAK